MTGKNLFAIVLAAGAASRFGATKQLVKVHGRPMVAGAVRTAEAVCKERTVVVLGNDWESVAEAASPLAGFLALNPGFTDGLSSSIRCGVQRVAHVADAVLLMLADQPLVSVANLEALIDAWLASPTHIVTSRYAGNCGPPVIFPSDFYPELLSLEGDRGARSVINANRDRVIEIDCQEAALDIDCPADLQDL